MKLVNCGTETICYGIWWAHVFKQSGQLEPNETAFYTDVWGAKLNVNLQTKTGQKLLEQYSVDIDSEVNFEISNGKARLSTTLNL